MENRSYIFLSIFVSCLLTFSSGAPRRKLIRSNDEFVNGYLFLPEEDPQNIGDYEKAGKVPPHPPIGRRSLDERRPARTVIQSKDEALKNIHSFLPEEDPQDIGDYEQGGAVPPHPPIGGRSLDPRHGRTVIRSKDEALKDVHSFLPEEDPQDIGDYEGTGGVPPHPPIGRRSLDPRHGKTVIQSKDESVKNVRSSLPEEDPQDIGDYEGTGAVPPHPPVGRRSLDPRHGRRLIQSKDEADKNVHSFLPENDPQDIGDYEKAGKVPPSPPLGGRSLDPRLERRLIKKKE